MEHIAFLNLLLFFLFLEKSWGGIVDWLKHAFSGNIFIQRQGQRKEMGEKEGGKRRGETREG